MSGLGLLGPCPSPSRVKAQNNQQPAPPLGAYTKLKHCFWLSHLGQLVRGNEGGDVGWLGRQRLKEKKSSFKGSRKRWAKGVAGGPEGWEGGQKEKEKKNIHVNQSDLLAGYEVRLRPGQFMQVMCCAGEHSKSNELFACPYEQLLYC
jgi:hypothetical protein